MKIITLALRTLTHFRLYSVINIIGLALSLACVIIISRYVNSELTVDHFVTNLERTYITVQETKNNPGEINLCGIYESIKENEFPHITKDPAVEQFSSFILFTEDEIKLNDKMFNCQTLVADSNFFKIMNYPILTGDTGRILQKPNEALITEKMANRLFGDKDPLGEILHTSTNKDVTITGIIGSPSTKSSIEFDLVLSIDLQDGWTRISQNLVQLLPNTNYKKINQKYSAFINAQQWNKEEIRYQLLPLNKAYFCPERNYFGNISGNYYQILILNLVAGSILLVGLFNFINIYSVVILRRAREFGMKKVFGAKAKSVFIQLLSENLSMIGIALFLSWILVEVTKPLVENILNINSVTNIQFDLLLSLSILLLLPIITTIMPFIRYNYSAPIVSLRSVNNSGTSTISRKIFLLAQYIITISLIVVSSFFVKQLEFMLHTDPGIRIHGVIQIPFIKTHNMMEREKLVEIVNDAKQKLDASPLFIHWTYGDSPVGDNAIHKFKTENSEYKEVDILSITRNWMQTFDIQMIEGELWSEEKEMSLSHDIYISESAKKLFNITDISKTKLQPEICLWMSSEIEGGTNQNPSYNILGIFKDFNTNHLAKQNNPVVITPEFTWPSNIIASITPGRRQEAIEFLKKLHNDTVGGEFEYTFIEDEFKNMYRKDKQTALIYSIFAMIAILISSLGLFSLSLFDVQQRFKEIAIRKVNGATDKMIMQMLLKKYLILLAIAFIIATPLSWLAITKYLEDFAHKAPISWWLFAIAFLITAGISLATLIFHIRKAARTNPAKAIKTE